MFKANNKLFLLLLFIFAFNFTPTASYSQTDLSFELQVYPTGIIPGISIDKHFGQSDVFYARVGGNFFDHRDLGEKENEEGSGYGFSLGYKRYFKDNKKGLRLGIKNDVWWNNVDWSDSDQFGSPIFGETDIVVLQPTAELSYLWLLGSISIAPSIAFGAEWNVKTKGEATGQGPIILVGLQIGKRLGGKL